MQSVNEMEIFPVPFARVCVNFDFELKFLKYFRYTKWYLIFLYSVWVFFRYCRHDFFFHPTRVVMSDVILTNCHLYAVDH